MKSYRQRAEERFIEVLANAYNAGMTLEEIDAAFAKARIELVEFMKANDNA